MIEAVCAFVVKEKARGQFELAFGPGGAWGALFASCPGFRGTTLLRDTRDLRRYLAVDLWDSEEQRERVLVECEAEIADLDAALGEWTESRTPIGVYRVLAEATVRPRSGVPRRRR
ncbi:MAG: hypothetical protein JXA09_00720 [Anaerolineae bacterium]|nr:hypothetical protein [Anaerolineae bacterium]